MPRMRESIPIYSPDRNAIETDSPPSKAHGNFVKLDQGFLKKQSYVRLPHVYEVPVALLRTYGYGPYARTYKPRLSHEGYSGLTTKLEMTEAVYDDTQTLFETAHSRLKMLACSQSHIGSNPPVDHGSHTSTCGFPAIMSTGGHSLHIDAPYDPQRTVDFQTGRNYYGSLSTRQASAENNFISQHCSSTCPYEESGADSPKSSLPMVVFLFIVTGAVLCWQYALGKK